MRNGEAICSTPTRGSEQVYSLLVLDSWHRQLFGDTRDGYRHLKLFVRRGLVGGIAARPCASFHQLRDSLSVCCPQEAFPRNRLPGL